jgi:hypothetical protein
MKLPKEVVMMPSGWMPDARHDNRMRSAFARDARGAAKQQADQVHSQHWTLHRKTHRTARPMRGVHA